MDEKHNKGHGFNKVLFCLYQSTSDDLMFWCWFDVLILSMNFGFDMKQISLLFSVSFWTALAMKIPCRYLARRIGVGRSVFLSAVLFLIAALFLTFGNSLAMAIVGQSIYLIAGSYQELATIIAKNAARRDPAHVDYMKLMSATGTIYSLISLAAALFMSRLYGFNPNLPMYICVGFCIHSCILAFFVSRYDMEGEKEDEETRREILPGVRIHAFDKTTISCLVLSILFMVIFNVSGDNLKIVIENDLSSIVGKNQTVFLFSMVLLGSRVVKIASNLLLYASRNNRVDIKKSFSFMAFGIFLVSVLGFMSRCTAGYHAILLAVAAFLLRVLVFDPFRYCIYEFMLRRLKSDKMIDVLFVQSTGGDMFTAVFSTMSTILLGFGGMYPVMLMLFMVGCLFLAAYLLFRRYLIRVSGSRAFLKWNKADISGLDSLMVAASALMMHYGIEEDAADMQSRLESGAVSVERITSDDSGMRFEGVSEYSEEALKEFYETGHPCAVLVACEEGDALQWLPVLYLDEDGGVVWNPYSKERFLGQLFSISKICYFSIS